MKAAITSPESLFMKKCVELQEKIDKQAEIIANQQCFLEAIDRREWETNVVVLGVPDEREALDSATTDDEKLSRVWGKMGGAGVECRHRRLGAEAGEGVRALCCSLSGTRTPDHESSVTPKSLRKQEGITPESLLRRMSTRV